MSRSGCPLDGGDRTACDLALATDDGLDLLGPCLLQLGEFVEGSRRRAAAASKGFFELGSQRQKGEMVGDARQIDAQPLGDLGIGFAGIGARAYEPGEIERRQAVTFLVLSDLRLDVMGWRAHDDRHDLESRPPRRTQALGAEDNSISAGLGNRAHDDRLKDAA